MDYVIAEVEQADIQTAYQPYGAAADFWRFKGREGVISGPAETGKSRGILEKLNAICWKYPGAQTAMVRKTYRSMPGSCIQTYEKKVLGAWNDETNEFDPSLTPVKKFGGEWPQFYEYPNGSRIWIGGMDNPAKVLSSERDIIVVIQAEELELDEWEHLLTRATGRAGNMPYSQVLGDVNPGPDTHWILQRERAGLLKIFHSRHEDNPVLFDQATGEITEQGKTTLAILDGLTGVRKSRLRYGLWVSAVGQVYEFERSRHVVKRFNIPAEWSRYRVIDFGLSHPFVCLWFAIDPSNQDLYMYREVYMTGRSVRSHSVTINDNSVMLNDQNTPVDEQFQATICDHDAEDRLTLAENGIPNIPAKKSILWGIGLVQDRLAKERGKGGLFFMEDSLIETDQDLLEQRMPTKTTDEFDVYLWANSATRDMPVDKDNHGMDCIRYMIAHLDGKRIPRKPEFNQNNPFYN